VIPLVTSIASDWGLLKVVVELPEAKVVRFDPSKLAEAYWSEEAVALLCTQYNLD
jgi:hypothetical protein